MKGNMNDSIVYDCRTKLTRNVLIKEDDQYFANSEGHYVAFLGNVLVINADNKTTKTVRVTSNPFLLHHLKDINIWNEFDSQAVDYIKKTPSVFDNDKKVNVIPFVFKTVPEFNPL